MKLLFLLLVLVFAVLGIAVVTIALRRKAPSSSPAYRLKLLLTEREQVAYARLLQAFPDYVVLAQVALSQVLAPVAKGAQRQSDLNRIDRLVLDFVICRRDSSVVAVFEFDDKSHSSARRVDADQRKDRFLSSVGVRVHRVGSEIPPAAALRALVVS